MRSLHVWSAAIFFSRHSDIEFSHESCEIRFDEQFYVTAPYSKVQIPLLDGVMLSCETGIHFTLGEINIFTFAVSLGLHRKLSFA